MVNSSWQAMQHHGQLPRAGPKDIRPSLLLCIQAPSQQSRSSHASRLGGGHPRLMSTSSLFMPVSCLALGMATSTLIGALPVMGWLANTGTVSAGAAMFGREGRRGRWAVGGERQTCLLHGVLSPPYRQPCCTPRAPAQSPNIRLHPGQAKPLPPPTRQLGRQLAHVHQVLRRPHSGHEAGELEPANLKEPVARTKAGHKAWALLIAVGRAEMGR